MILKLFTQPNCPKCPTAKELVKNLKIKNSSGIENLKIENFDVIQADGLAEASFYSVMGTPSLILCDDQGKEIAGWRSETPTLENLKIKLQNAK